MNTSPRVLSLVLSASLVALAPLAGCASTQPAGPVVRWETQAQGPVSKLVVRTQRLDPITRRSDDDPRYRGYQLYDATGKLVYERPSHLDEEDIAWVKPGRYAAVAKVRTSWFTFRETRVTFQVDPEDTVILDLTRMNEPLPSE